MYPYHNKAKQLIRNGHLTHWEIVEKWNHIEHALVLYFDNHRPIPIRPHRHEEYFQILNITVAAGISDATTKLT